MGWRRWLLRQGGLPKGTARAETWREQKKSWTTGRAGEKFKVVTAEVGV